MTTETTPPAANTTATITSPIVTGDNPQPVVESPVVEKAAETVVADPAAPPVEGDLAAKPNNNDWALKRINELTAKRYAAERAAEAAVADAALEKAKVADLLAQLAKPTDPNAVKPTTPVVSEEEIEKRAVEKAKQMAQASEFNKACNAIVEAGKKDFASTWDESIKNLGLVGAIGQGASPAFLETAIELKNPAAILNHLGKNLEEAERIAKLPPTKMAMEMARVEALINAPAPVVAAPPVSNAPAPVIPVGGAAKPGEKSINDPNLTSEEFYALRAKQIDEKRNRYKRA